MRSIQREFCPTARRTKAPRLWPSRAQRLRGATNANSPASRGAAAARPPANGVFNEATHAPYNVEVTVTQDTRVNE